MVHLGRILRGFSCTNGFPKIGRGTTGEAGTRFARCSRAGASARAMISIATIAATIERQRDSVLAGREHFSTAEAWRAVTRLLLTERRDVRDHRRRRAAILVRVPMRRLS